MRLLTFHAGVAWYVPQTLGYTQREHQVRIPMNSCSYTLNDFSHIPQHMYAKYDPIPRLCEVGNRTLSFSSDLNMIVYGTGGSKRSNILRLNNSLSSRRCVLKYFSSLYSLAMNTVLIKHNMLNFRFGKILSSCLQRMSNSKSVSPVIM